MTVRTHTHRGDQECLDPHCRHVGLWSKHDGPCPVDPGEACPRRAARLPDALTTNVVGVTFCPGYPASMGQLEALARGRMMRGDSDEMEPIPAVLIRAPENEHDPNAIEVHVPLLDQQVGHLAASMAAKVAPTMDDGARWLASIIDVRVSPEAPNRPGIRIRLTRVPDSVTFGLPSGRAAG